MICEYVLAAFPRVPKQLAEITEKIFPEAVLVEGGAQDLVKTLDTNKRTVVIIDGPKSSVPAEADAWTHLMDELRRFQNISAIFLHDSRREWASGNSQRLVEYYSQHLWREYSLCFMSPSVLGKLFPVLELGGDVSFQRVLPSNLPNGHISRILSHGVSNLAFLIKRV